MNKRPNILFIMSDDHAANAISAYGSRINTTPNIDRIANEGARLNHCYVTNSICTPSRACILTGTHNHINGVTTLDTHIDNRLPNVAKHLKRSGYQTAMVGKWHLGEGSQHEPTGFDYWSVVPGQGRYYNPEFIESDGMHVEEGYVTDITADKCIQWLDQRNKDEPFFLMCHHKAPHRPWDPKDIHRSLYTDDFPEPETFDDDYANRAQAAEVAKMRIADNLSFRDLDLFNPDDPDEMKREWSNYFLTTPENIEGYTLTCAITGDVFSFTSQEELKRFKYNRYIRKYTQCIHSIDENVGRMLDWLDDNNLAEDTVVIYTSDQGFYLGEHGWYDKRFIYEESFQMPFLIRYPREIPAGSICTDMLSNVDFAPSFLDYAETQIPNYMQGRSARSLFKGKTPSDWTDLAYHRYWMNNDSCHSASAHYGIRTHHYKLIYWYYDDLGQPGANPSDLTPERELFDLKQDPLEVCNVYDDPAYATVVQDMTKRLEDEMDRIGDVPVH